MREGGPIFVVNASLRSDVSAIQAYMKTSIMMNVPISGKSWVDKFTGFEFILSYVSNF